MFSSSALSLSPLVSIGHYPSTGPLHAWKTSDKYKDTLKTAKKDIQTDISSWLSSYGILSSTAQKATQSFINNLVEASYSRIEKNIKDSIDSVGDDSEKLAKKIRETFTQSDGTVFYNCIFAPTYDNTLDKHISAFKEEVRAATSDATFAKELREKIEEIVVKNQCFLAGELYLDMEGNGKVTHSVIILTGLYMK